MIPSDIKSMAEIARRISGEISNQGAEDKILADMAYRKEQRKPYRMFRAKDMEHNVYEGKC